MASSASNLGPTNPELLDDGRASACAAYREENGLAADAPVPVDAVTASGSGLDPHISVANARLQAPRVARARGLAASRRCWSSSTSTPTAARSASSASRGVNVLELNLALDAKRSRSRLLRAMAARRRSASTSAPRPASARRSRCSTRAGAGTSAAPTSSSASSRRTAAPKTAEQIGDLEVVPREADRVPRRDVRGDGRRRGPRPAARRSRSSTSSRTRTSPARATRSAGRTSRSCSTPASTSSRRSTSSTSSRSTTSSSGSPGVKQRETIPDEVVRRADQIELVDMTPEALRRRMAHGNIYPPERIDAALGNYFRDGQPRRAARARAPLGRRPRRRGARGVPRRRTASTGPWETRERVVVALTGAADGDRLVRRAARMAQRAEGRPRRGARAPAGRPGRAGGRRARPAARRSSRSSAGPTARSSAPTSATALVVGGAHAERDADRARRDPPVALAASSRAAR